MTGLFAILLIIPVVVKRIEMAAARMVLAWPPRCLRC